MVPHFTEDWTALQNKEWGSTPKTVKSSGRCLQTKNENNKCGT